jgi:hypothetical protein
MVPSIHAYVFAAVFSLQIFSPKFSPMHATFLKLHSVLYGSHVCVYSGLSNPVSPEHSLLFAIPLCTSPVNNVYVAHC